MSTPRIDLGNGHTHEPTGPIPVVKVPAELLDPVTGGAPIIGDFSQYEPGPDTVDECGGCGQQDGHKPGCRYAPIPTEAEQAAEAAEQRAAGMEDPGPMPAERTPEPPILTLKQRIANALDRAIQLPWPEDREQIVEVIHAEVSAGADYSERPDNAEMTPGQALAYLLDLPEWSRLDRLGSLLDQAHKGSTCFVMNHGGLEAELHAVRQAMIRYRTALDRIARMTSTVDQPESAHGNVIGQIAAEALVQP